MKFSIQRELLLKPLQQIIGAVERRQVMPMLSNVLLRSSEAGLTMVATDLEVELLADVDLDIESPGETTLPARKLLDICKNLPESANLSLQVAEGRATLSAMRSRFVLATLPAADFPVIEDIRAGQRVTLARQALKRLIEKTSFAMAQQDVRYYLNGLLLHIGEGSLRAVATDGHRLATSIERIEIADDVVSQVIIPRKGVQELQRLLTDGDGTIDIELSANHIRARIGELRFTSKLVDGRFPDYDRVLPKDSDKTLRVNSEALRQGLIRTAILSSEKYRGVRLALDGQTLKIQAHNPDQEEAEEDLEVEYDGEPLEIGFNVNYLLDVLGAINSDAIEIKLKDANSSALLRASVSEDSLYVVMPMRL
ncbi:MAG: DNA polymerase III subunit beta [Gammaproteobacteria bacterium]